MMLSIQCVMVNHIGDVNSYQISKLNPSKMKHHSILMQKLPASFREHAPMREAYPSKETDKLLLPRDGQDCVACLLNSLLQYDIID